MAQMEGMRRYEDSHAPTQSSTIERLCSGDQSKWHATTTPSLAQIHDLEEDHSSPVKKSVLTKVKEKANKWRNTLSKKQPDSDNSTPAWGVSLDDDDDYVAAGDEIEDPEYFGAPMYESEKAPNGHKESGRQHPVPVISDKNASVNRDVFTFTTQSPEGQKYSEKNSSKTITETVTGKLTPAYNMVSGSVTDTYSMVSGNVIAPAYNMVSGSVISPAYNMVSGATQMIASKIPFQARSAPAATTETTTSGENTSIVERKWDKGVSVKEYLLQKLEPGEEEKALSQVISEAISPRKSNDDVGVVEKVRDTVSSLMLPTDDESSSEETATTSIAASTTSTSTSTSTNIPLSTNAYEVVEDENQGRILQAN